MRVRIQTRRNQKRTAYVVACAVTCAFLTGAGAKAGVIWDEGVDGDLSSDHLGPIALNLGSNSISGVTMSGDRDYVTIVVPAGLRITPCPRTYNRL